MNSRALTIGTLERTKIAGLIAYAKLHPITPPSRFDQRDHTIDLPFGYRVTYTRDRVRSGLYHHISISVSTVGNLPHPAAVAMICDEFGLQNVAKLLDRMNDTTVRDESIKIWPEEFDQGHHAINIVMKIT